MVAFAGVDDRARVGVSDDGAVVCYHHRALPVVMTQSDEGKTVSLCPCEVVEDFQQMLGQLQVWGERAREILEEGG